MSKITAAITGVGGYVPDYVLDNRELERMVETNDEWIKSRTGIEERRLLKIPGKATSDMGAEAAKVVLEKTGTAPEEIDLVICATVTGDYPFPDTANIIAHKINVKNAFCFDLNAACSGFLYALVTASKFVESGSHRKVLVVGADMMSSIVDYEDRSTCILFGDGAGAVLLEPSTNGEGIHDSILRGDGSGKDLLFMKAGGSMHPASAETVAAKEHYAFQNGRPVFKAAVSNMADVVQRVIHRNGLTADDINWVVPHQANKRILESVARMADIPMEKVMINIQKYGNTTAATLPLCLRDWEEQLKTGDRLVLTAFGGGFTWGAIYLTWAYN